MGYFLKPLLVAQPYRNSETVCQQYCADEGCLSRLTADAGLYKRITCLLESGQGIRTLHELLGHADVSTTHFYERAESGGSTVISPADRARGL